MGMSTLWGLVLAWCAMSVVLRLRPRLHVFGHIHESAGMFKTEGVGFLNVANEPTRLLI